MPSRSVIIIGGGFAGAAVAVHLRRMVGPGISVRVVEPRDRLGAGLAYGTTDPAHRINVPSDVMTVLADAPRTFTDWLQRTGRRSADPEGEDGSGAHYSRRMDFGAFMADLIAGKVIALRGVIDHIRDRAVSIVPGRHGAAVTLEGGRMLTVDRVILATSHDRPALPFLIPAAIADHRGYINDPWDTKRLSGIGPDARVVVFGTGLTMVDVVCGLLERGHRGTILAVSRRGLLPQPHGAFSPVVPVTASDFPRSAASAVQLVRRLVRSEIASGRDWHTAVDGIRRVAEPIWRSLPVDEQSRLLHRVRPFWDVHRFRIAPQLAARIARAQTHGQVRVAAAGVVGLGQAGNGMAPVLRHRDGTTEAVACDVVVNCLGPRADVTRRDDPILQTLFAAGQARPDPHRLGVDVDDAFRLLDAAGRPTPSLCAVGPLTRGIFWEVVGVPELSAHCRRLAETLVAETAMADV